MPPNQNPESHQVHIFQTPENLPPLLATAVHTRERLAVDQQAQEYRGTTGREQSGRDGHSADVEDPRGAQAGIKTSRSIPHFEYV
jgi:hypothetical protein